MSRVGLRLVVCGLLLVASVSHAEGPWWGLGGGAGYATPFGGLMGHAQGHLGYRPGGRLGLAGTVAFGAAVAWPSDDFAAVYTFPHARVGALVDLQLVGPLWVSAGPVVAYGSLSASPAQTEGWSISRVGEAGGAAASFKPGLEARVGVFLSTTPGPGPRAGVTFALQLLMLVHPRMDLSWGLFCGFRGCVPGTTTQDVLTTFNPALVVGYEWR